MDAKRLKNEIEKEVYLAELPLLTPLGPDSRAVRH